MKAGQKALYIDRSMFYQNMNNAYIAEHLVTIVEVNKDRATISFPPVNGKSPVKVVKLHNLQPYREGEL